MTDTVPTHNDDARTPALERPAPETERARRSPNEAFAALRESVEELRDEVSALSVAHAEREHEAVATLRKAVEALLRIHAIAMQAKGDKVAATVEAAVEAELSHLGLALVKPLVDAAVDVATIEVVSGEAPGLLKNARPGTVTRVLRAGARHEDSGVILVRAQVVAWRERA